MIRVLLVTTWDTACGIAEHSAMLKEAVERADSEIEVIPSPEILDPDSPAFRAIDVLHLNYQANLHSRWTAEKIHAARSSGLYKAVIVTYHDTGVPNSDQCKSVINAADFAVVHEPFDDLPFNKTQYWRMGVPAGHNGKRYEPFATGYWKAWPEQPVLGTVGFPFPWKCYDQLAMVTAKAGWALFLVAPDSTPEQRKQWSALNPAIYVSANFVPRRDVVGLLSNCDATAFTYVTHNTGQSGAILQGIAARKPVIALSTCRQFRALHGDDVGHRAIRWATTFEDVYDLLINMPIQRVDPKVVALAEQDSWERLGKKYTELYRSLA